MQSKPQAQASAPNPAETEAKPAAKAERTPKPAKAAAGGAAGATAKTKTDRAKADRASRAERIEAAQRSRRRKEILVRVAVIGTAVILIGVVAFVVINNRQEKSQAIQQLETGSCNYDEDSDRDAGPGRNHVGGNLAYDTNPPSGGNHNPQPAPAGQYTAEQAPPDAQVVHSMEHGYIILWYKPDLPEDVQNQLKALAEKHAKDVLLVPRAQMDTPVAATAWHRRLLCQNFEDGPLEEFINRYVNQGPEKIPHQ